jgi:hypothetical protein
VLEEAVVLQVMYTSEEDVKEGQRAQSKEGRRQRRVKVKVKVKVSLLRKVNTAL